MLLKCKIIISLFFVTANLHVCIGQFNPFKNINAQLNLPSFETYSIHQDKAGFIWIATDAGVCKYDGYNLKIIDDNGGLTDNTILGFYEDIKGRLWFNANNGKICFYQNEKIYQLNKSVYNKLQASLKKSVISSLYVDKGDTIWVGFAYGESYLKIFNHFTEVEKVTFPKQGMFVLQIEGEGRIFGRADSNCTSNDFNVYNKNKVSLKITGPQIKHYYKYLQSYKPINKNGFIYSHKNILYIYKNNKIKIKKFNHEVVSLCVIDSVNFEIATSNKKLLFYNLTNDKTQTLTIDENITCILKDNTNAIWYSTQNDGIFYAPSIYYKDMLQQSILKNNTTVDFTVTKNHLVYINKKNTLFIKNKNSGLTKKIEIKTELNRTQAINSNLFICSGLETFLIDTLGQKTILYYKNNPNLFNILHVSKVIDNRVYFADRNILYSMNVVSKKVDSVSYSLSRIRDIKIDTKNNLWVATNDGISFLNLTTKSAKLKQAGITNKSVESIVLDKDNNVFFCLKKLGVFKYNIASKQTIAIKNLQANLYRNIYIDDNKKSIWVATNKGIVRINDNNTTTTINNYDNTDGLESEDIKKIITNNGKLYALTNTELLITNEKVFEPITKFIKTLLVHVNSNSKTFNSDSVIKLNYNEPITVRLKGLTFKWQDKIKYYYSISTTNNWVLISGNSVVFSSASWGNYDIHFKAVSTKNNSLWQSKKITLNIKTPYYYTWWFLVTVAVLTTLFLYCAITTYITNQKKKYISNIRIERRISELKLQAIRAQMNPHFISNTISSIQYYIMQNDIEKSFEYLSNFSALIRMIFEMSFEETISLKEELKMLKLYVNLERLRFTAPFEFELLVEDKLLNQPLQIPGMLLQPYIENAIIHGLMPKREPGKLKLNFYSVKNDLIITITDNGIGRVKSAELNSKKTKKSKGITLTLEKVDILNQNNKHKIAVVITDLMTHNLSEGTEVTVTIFDIIL